MHPRLASLLLPVCLGGAWLPASAQNTLTVPIEVVHVSNPNLIAPRRAEDGDAEAAMRDETRRGDATLIRLHPRYTLQMVNEASRWELTLGGLIERSSDTALSANRSLPSVSGLWENDNPTGRIRLRASLEEESTREAEFADFGRVVVDSTRRTGSVGAAWTTELTSNADLELALSHARVAYDTSLLRDYDETEASARYRWQHDTNGRYVLTAIAARLERDGGIGRDEPPDRLSRHGIILDYELALSEGMTLTAGVGAMRAGSPDNRTRAVGSLRLAREGERLGYALEWGRTFSADGAARGYVRIDTLGASLSYRLSEDTTFTAGVNHARALDGEREDGSLAYARIRSDLTRFWAATGGLEYRRARSADHAPFARGHAVILGLVYTHPDF